MVKKNYSSAPLPFMGQKRRYVKLFKECLKHYSGQFTFVDLFGGSGLLSHTVKSVFPDSKVVYNDFDNFRKRLKAIPVTNKILNELRNVLNGYPEDKRITGESLQKVMEVLKQAEKKYNYVDYITLSSSLLFSMNYVQSLEKMLEQTMYNCVRKSDYNAEGYLSGVDFVRMDYKELFDKYKNESNVVFFVDPPYLSTESGTYGGYWKLKDYLDVLNVLDGTNYFYFTSNKSNIVELCEWIESRSNLANPFAGSKEYKICSNMNYTASYTDIMRVKYSYKPE